MRMKKSRRARGKRPSANTYERPWGSERRLGRERERERERVSLGTRGEK
jgi:hypothetical protein